MLINKCLLQKISSMTDVKPNDFQLNYLVTTF